MISIENLQKEYDQFRLECSLKVMPGQVTGLVGQNGTGKSTIFKALLGLILRGNGTIQIMGKDIDELSAEDKQKIGVVLNDSGFSGYLTIKDIVPILTHMYPLFEKEIFLQQCNSFGLPINKKIKDFSTGMKTKLKILIAVSHKASLLILDEPTSGLDVVARDELLTILREYMERDENNTILISSHISTDLEGFCDNLYMIHDGKIVWEEDTDVLLSDYAILKISNEQFNAIDKSYLIKMKKESFGYCCLTNQKQYYYENYPKIIVEKGSLDDFMFMMIKGENL